MLLLILLSFRTLLCQVIERGLLAWLFTQARRLLLGMNGSGNGCGGSGEGNIVRRTL